MAGKGSYYFGVKVSESLSKDGEIYLHSDAHELSPNGDAVFYNIEGERKKVVLIIKRDFWICIFAASCIDGSACYVDHWTGEIIDS